MISEAITDHRAAYLLMRRIQFIWGALDVSHSQLSVKMEKWSEHQAQTGLTKETVAERDREFRVFLKGDEIRQHLRNRSFKAVPFPTLLSVTGNVDSSHDVVSDFKLWSGMILGEHLGGINLTCTVQLVFRGEESTQANSWDLLLRGSGQKFGDRAPMPSHCAITAPADAPPQVLLAIEEIGYDKELEEEIRQSNSNAFNYRSDNRPQNSLSRCDGSRLITTAFRLVDEHLQQKLPAKLFIRAMINFPGHFLLAGRDMNENQATEDFLKGRADCLSEALLASTLEKEWKIQIGGASEEAGYGPGWDRKGSVLENVDTKMIVTTLKRAGKKHDLVLHYRGGKYQLEIEGLPVDSESGRIISDFGVAFVNGVSPWI